MGLNFFIGQLRRVSAPDLKMRTSVGGRQNAAQWHGLHSSKQ